MEPQQATNNHGSIKEEASTTSARLATSENLEYDGLHVVCPPHTTERKLMNKIDLQVIPYLVVLYTLAFLDRVNIANAKSFGLLSDLNMDQTPGVGVQYNIALVSAFSLLLRLSQNTILISLSDDLLRALHSIRSAIEYTTQEIQSTNLALKLYVCIWLRFNLSRARNELWRSSYHSLFPRIGRSFYVSRMFLSHRDVV